MAPRDTFASASQLSQHGSKLKRTRIDEGTRNSLGESRRGYHTSRHSHADTVGVSPGIDQFVLASGIDVLTNIGRDTPLLVVSGLAVAGGLLAWRAASRRAAAARKRLDDIDRRIEGPTTRDLCRELAKIITPYRKGTYGKPIEDRLSPERRFLRNLRVQLRLSRQRRQRIEAMHAENIAECARLRDELEAIRKASEEAASLIAQVTMVGRDDLSAPPSPAPESTNAAPTDTASEAPSAVEAPESHERVEQDVVQPEVADAESVAPSPDAASPASRNADATDDVADLVFSALDEPALETPPEAPVFGESPVVDEDAGAESGDAGTEAIDATTDEPIDFDTLLAESAAKLGVQPTDDESLGGVEAFERQLAEAGFRQETNDAANQAENAGDDVSEHIAPQVDESAITVDASDESAQVAEDIDALANDTFVEGAVNVDEAPEEASVNDPASDDVSDDDVDPAIAAVEAALDSDVDAANATSAEADAFDVDDVAPDAALNELMSDVAAETDTDIESIVAPTLDVSRDADGRTSETEAFDVDDVDAEAPAVDTLMNAAIDDDAELQSVGPAESDASDSKKKLTPDEVSAEPADLVADAPSDESALSAAQSSRPTTEPDSEPTRLMNDDVFADTSDQRVEDAFSDIDALVADEVAADDLDLASIPQADVSDSSPAPKAAPPTDAAANDAVPTNLVARAQAEIAAAIERADRSRQALETLDDSLNQNLAHRREMIAKVDSALAERQIQLVTDILRAEAEHLSLTDALNQIRASVEAMQADVSSILGAAPDSNDPPRQ